MSMPACAWVPRSSPKSPVRTPRTGVTVEQSSESARDGRGGLGRGVAGSSARSSRDERAGRRASAAPPRGRRGALRGGDGGRGSRSAARVVATPAGAGRSARVDLGASRRNSTRERKIADHVAASTTPVGGEPVRRLEALDGALGDRAEDAVVVDADPALHLRDGVAGRSRAAAATRRRGVAAGSTARRRRRRRTAPPASDSSGVTGAVTTAPASATDVALRLPRAAAAELGDVAAVLRALERPLPEALVGEIALPGDPEAAIGEVANVRVHGVSSSSSLAAYEVS